MDRVDVPLFNKKIICMQYAHNDLNQRLVRMKWNANIHRILKIFLRPENKRI